LIVLGGGYDPRAAKLLYDGQVDRVYELDLPPVVKSKRQLLTRAFAGFITEEFCLEAVDLNDSEVVDRTLNKIETELKQIGPLSSWHTIVISEALLLYLNPGVGGSILERLSRRFGKKKRSAATFVFADRLELNDAKTNAMRDVDGTKVKSSHIRRWLLERGWMLQDFSTKSGATRHLGIATSSSTLL
jgi:O-methyltransferase involved in polyketide biosynthesis